MPKRRIYCVFGYECNNNCLFCAVDSESHKNRLLSLAEINRFLERLNDEREFEIEISGGEPTCRRTELFYFLERLTTSFPGVTHVMLSNGRNFSNAGLAAKFSDLNPYSVLIPIHANTPQLHDKLTQMPGSFEETVRGIKNLYEYNVTVGLKTVVNNLNYTRLPHIVEMVAQVFPECEGITLNGLELQGKGLINKNIVGLKLSEAAQHIEAAIDMANKYGFKIMTYSIPPCILREGYRKFAGIKRRSTIISKTPLADMQHVKLTYGTVEKCASCKLYAGCTGAWYSYLDNYGTDELIPIE